MSTIQNLQLQLDLVEQIVRRAKTTDELKPALARLNSLKHNHPEDLSYRIIKARCRMLRGVILSKSSILPQGNWYGSRADSLVGAELHLSKALDALDPILDVIEGVSALRVACTFEAKVVESRLPVNGRTISVSHDTRPLSGRDRSTVEYCLAHGLVLNSRF